MHTGLGEQLALVIIVQAMFTREEPANFPTISYCINVTGFFLEGHFETRTKMWDMTLYLFAIFVQSAWVELKMVKQMTTNTA